MCTYLDMFQPTQQISEKQFISMGQTYTKDWILQI